MDVKRLTAVSACLALALGALGVPAQATAQDWIYVGPDSPMVDAFAVSPRGTGSVVAHVDPGMGVSAYSVWSTAGYVEEWTPLLEAGRWDVGGVAFTRDGQALVGQPGGVLRREHGAAHWEFLDIAPNEGQVGRMAALGFSDVLAQVRGPSGTGEAMRIAHLDTETGTLHDRTPATLPVDHAEVTVLVTHADDQRVVLATDRFISDTAIDPGVWFSDDAGHTWTELEEGLRPARQLAAAAFDHEGVVAVFVRGWQDSAGQTGVYRSNDGGQHWQLLDGPFVRPQQVVADPSSAGRLWVGAEDGLYRTDDGGQSWQLAHTLDDPWQVLALATHPATGAVLVSTLRYGARQFVSSVGQLAPLGYGLGAVDTGSVSAHPWQPYRVEALAREQPMVFSSFEGGWNWLRDPDFHANRARQLRHTPDGRLLAAGTRNNFGPLARNHEGAWGTLSSLPAGLVQPQVDAVSSRQGGNTLFAAVRHRVDNQPRGLVMASTTSGASWQVVGGFPGPITQLDLHPAHAEGNGRVMLVGHRGHDLPVGIQVLDPQTGDWSSGGQGLPTTLRSVQSCATSGALNLQVAWVAGHVDGRTQLYRSRNGGLSFEHAHTLGQWTGYPTALWCDPSHPDVAVVGHDTGMVMHVGGAAPQLLGNALAQRQAGVADFERVMGELYAATRQGTWSIPLPLLTPFRPEGLTVTLSGARMRPDATLAWTGGTSEVVVRRNGVQVYSGPNTGHFSERLAPHQGNPTYTVCNSSWPSVCAQASP